MLAKQLLGGSKFSPSDLLKCLPELPAVAVLFFYALLPPRAGSGRAAEPAARHAAADLQAVFCEVHQQQQLMGAAAAPAQNAGVAAAKLRAGQHSCAAGWLQCEHEASSSRPLMITSRLRQRLPCMSGLSLCCYSS